MCLRSLLPFFINFKLLQCPLAGKTDRRAVITGTFGPFVPVSIPSCAIGGSILTFPPRRAAITRPYNVTASTSLRWAAITSDGMKVYMCGVDDNVVIPKGAV